MRKTVIKCDRCGKEIPAYPFRLVPYQNERETGDILGNQPYEKTEKEWDYCRECIGRILEFAHNRVEATTEPEAEAKPVEGVSHTAVSGEYMSISEAKADAAEKLVAVAKVDVTKSTAPQASEKPKGRRLTKADRKIICDCFQKGMTTKEITEKFGCSRTTVNRALEKEGGYM